MLAEVAEALVCAALADHPQDKTISWLAISASNLEEHPILQLERGG
jgi:DNA polymerase-4